MLSRCCNKKLELFLEMLIEHPLTIESCKSILHLKCVECNRLLCLDLSAIPRVHFNMLGQLLNDSHNIVWKKEDIKNVE